ncbi:MAG: NTP/NDP exchange transporter [Gammaproteobacteria bacterium]
MTDPEPTPAQHKLARALQRLVDLRPHETAAALWSFAYFFCLLSSYYILRPLRDEMGIAGGIESLHWVFTGTFVVMLLAVPLFGWAAARFARAKLLPLVYLFFVANILIFYVLFELDVGTVVVARVFFIWTSVFNLFVVSVFWSFMADLFSNAQARRLFGFIAAGGSAGAVVGPAVTGILAGSLGPINLLPISTAILVGAVLCIRKLNRCAPQEAGETHEPRDRTPLGGGILAGVKLVLTSPYLLGICLFIWLYTTLATFVYLGQARIVANAFDDPATRTAVFAGMDFAVNCLTIVIQAALTGRIIKWLGMPLTLALIPILTAGGFAGLGMAPVLPVLVAFQIMRRAGSYSISSPAREILFTVVDRETKYKAKNFIDTVVYRGGDAIGSWIFAGLTVLGLGLSGIAVIAVPVALVWAANALYLGRRQETLKQAAEIDHRAKLSATSSAQVKHATAKPHSHGVHPPRCA